MESKWKIILKVKIVSLHILKEWTTWFLGSLFFLMGTIFLFVLVEDFARIFPQDQANLKDFTWWMVEYLPWVMPICSLLASLFTLAFLKKRGEWVAIQSTGISTIQALGGIAKSLQMAKTGKLYRLLTSWSERTLS